MTIRVNAFGKTIAFPAGTSLEDIEKHISSNRSLLDPEYKAPETGMLGKAAQFGKEFAQNSLGVDMGIDTSKQPTGQDYLKGFASGANKLVSGIGYLAEVAGAKDTGRSIREFGDRGAAYWNNLMSPAGLKAASDQVFEEVGENDGSLEFDFGDEPTEIFEDDRTSLFGLRLSRNWANALLMGAAQSAPSMFAAAVPGAITTSAIQKLASLGLAGGSGATIPLLAGTAAPVGVASNIIARTPAAIGFGSAEGITAGAMNAADLKSSIEGMPIEELRKSPVFAVLESEHGEDTARSLIAEQAASDVFGRTAVSTGAIGALTGGGALGQAYQKATGAAKGGMFNQAVKGTTQEALQEAPQSGMEKLIENVAVRDYLNPDQKIMEGVLADAASGAAIGGLMGGVVGGAGAVNVSASRAAKINEERTKLGLNKIASSGSVDEAINAAAETVSQKPVTPKDIWDDQAARDDLLMRAEQINQQKGVQNEAQVQGTETPAAEADVLSAKQAETLLNQAVANDESNSIPSPAQLDKDASGSDIIAQNLGNAAKGAATEIILPDNTTLPAEWMVVDADNVKATMKNGINQPRDRTRAAADVQIQQIANQPDYRRMSDSPVMDIGAPTLDSYGAIVGGNGRFEGVSRGYDAGTSAAYRAALEADAVKKGIDPATFAGMKKPVLVRRVTQPFDTQKLAVASNSGGSLEYSALERAKIDAERIGDIDQIEVTDSGDIALTKDNAANIRNALKGYSASELGSFVDNEGNLSQEGSRRLKNAILYSAYGNSKTLSRMVESTDTDMRNIVGALTKTAGQAARVRKNISQGGLPKSLDITDNLIEAVEKIGQIRSSGDTVDNYLSQGELFSDIALSEETKEIMTGLSDVMRSQKRMVEFLRATYNLIEKVDVTTDNVFGEPDIPKKLEVVKHAKQQTAEQRPASLFGEEAGTESAAKINNITSAEAGAKYSRSPEERLKDRERSRKLERALQREGYDFRIQARDVRLGITPDGKGQEAIAAEQIARIFRKRISWIEAEGDFQINGVMVPNIPDTIFIDVNTNKAAHIVMGHELSHHMEQDVPEVYQAMVDALMPMIRDVDAYRASRNLGDMKRENVIKEIVGDIVGDNFAKPEFWNKVAAYNPNAFRKIADTIISWIKRLVTNAKARGLGSEQWVTDAQKAQDIVAKAVSQYTYTESSFDGLKNKPVFQKAWHGSPHDHDKFDASKIGTGEGAQAYGWGLYFTDTREVAEYYRGQLTGAFKTGNEELDTQLIANGGNLDEAISELKERASKSPESRRSIWTDALSVAEKIKRDGGIQVTRGRIYEVELAPEPDEYLLWDKPLSQQSEKVRKALFEIRKSHPKDSVFSQSLQPFENSAGDSLYRALSRDSRNAAEASKIMHSAGIRGIKYLDGSSRRTGEGSYNYVIFDDKDVEITAKFSKQGELDLDPPTNKTKPKDDLQLESQNLKGNTKSKNPSGVIGELNYDNIQQRPGTTEKQREAGRNAYRQLLERIVSRGRGRLLGSSIAKNFREGKGASLVGQKVESSEDLAVLAQILRDPRFETFRIFYVKDGTVVHHTGVSSRIPASSRIFKVSDSPEKFYESIKANMQNLGADGYYLLHNHPSGKAEPSGADIGLTEGIEMNAPGFISHVIIDHNEYGEITIKRKGISKQTISDVKYRDMPGNETYQSILPHKLLGSKVSGPLDIVSMGKQLQLPDGYFTVIGLDAQLKVSSLSEFPTSILKNPDIYLFGILRRYARNSGADAVAIVTNNTEYNVDIRSKLVYSGLRNNILLDVIDANTGVSYAEQSGYGGRGIFNKGKAYERVHEVNESGEKYDNGKESIPDTITIDGKERPTRNSNGKLIHPTEEGIRNFWVWFGESEVVDKEGKPKVVYHGSNKDNISNFDPALSRDIGIHFSEKDLSKKFGGIKYEAYLKIENSASILDIFSVDGSGYEVYSRQVPGAIDTALDLLADQSDDLYDLGHKVEKSWSDDREVVNVKSRPYKKFWKEVSRLAKEVGVDGFEYINRYEGGGHSYVVFSPNQIKSATGNTGQFSPDNDDIRFSRASGNSKVNKYLSDYKGIYSELLSDDFIKNNDFDAWASLRDKAVGIRNAISDMLDNGDINGLGVDGDALLSRNSNGSKNAWRITYFDDNGNPNGHSEYVDAKNAVSDFLNPSRSNKVIALFSRSDTLSQAGVNTEEAAKPSSLPEETKTQAFRRRSQDAMLRFKVVQNWLKEQGVNLSEAANVYQRENISKGKTANRIEDFRREQLEPLIRRIAETSKKATGEGKFDLADIATYLEAVHIPEANERMRTIHKDDKATANGITDDQARKVVKQFESMPNFAEFKKLADDVRKIGIDTLDMRLDAGLISQEQYDAYKSTYKNWVPLRGNMSKQGFGKGMSTNAKDKRRMGHGFREEEFVIENLVQDRERAIMQIEKNKIGMTVAQFLMEAENPNIGTIDKPEKMRVMKDFSYAVTFKGRTVGSFETESGARNAINKIMERKGDLLPEGESFTQTDFNIDKSYDPHMVMMARPQLAENEIQVYVNGHAVKLQLNDPGLARAATNAGIEQVGAIAHGARMFNRFLSKAYTAWSPDFLFMNMARDAYSGTLVLTGKKGAAFAAKTFTNYGTAVRELIKGRNDPKKSEWVSRYRAAGGNIGAAYLSDIERVGEDALAALQEFSGARETYRMVYNEQISKGSSPTKARTMAALKAGVAKTKSAPVVGHMFKTLERVNMVIENALRLATFKAAVESGESDQQAAMLSKDLMNFNRKGEMANQMGALYLFYNPGMQGAHIVGEALFTSKHRKQVWALLGALTTLSFILAEFARGGEDDDDREWENTPDYIKDRNLIFQFGDKQITVPVAYGFGIFHAMGNYLSDLNHGADKSEIAVKLASGMFENFSVFGNPIVGDDGDTEIRMDQILPTLPKLIMAPGINMDSLGRQIHPTKYQDSVPDSQLMWRSVRGTAYEDIAHFMNDITGGSQYNPGAIDISPNTIKYWVTALTGGAGRFVSDITTGGLNAAEGISPEIENVPVLRKFIREPGVNDSRGAFHKAKKEAQTAAERAGKALRNGDMPEYTKMMTELQPIIDIAKYASDAQKMASMARDEIMRIQLDKDMSKAEKKLRIKEIELQEQRVYDQFLSAFDVAKEVIKK